MFSSKRHLLDHGAAGAVDELPVDDVPERVRIDDHADVVGADVAQEIELAGLAMNPHLGDQRDEGREVPAERDAAADRDVLVLLVVARRRPLLPAVALGRNPHRVAIARMLEILQPELDRIGVGRGRQSRR